MLGKARCAVGRCFERRQYLDVLHTGVIAGGSPLYALHIGAREEQATV